MYIRIVYTKKTQYLLDYILIVKNVTCQIVIVDIRYRYVVYRACKSEKMLCK